MGIVGEYNVVLEVSDTAGNKSNFTLVIVVKDEIAPIINGPNVLEVDVNQPPLLGDIIDTSYTMYDEYDGGLPYEIMVDHYTSSKDTIGSYLVSFEVTDTSGNITIQTFTIEVKDYDPPIMESSSNYTTNVDQLETTDAIIHNLIFSDNYDTDLTIEVVENTYISNEQTVGQYFLKIKVTDQSLNESIFTIHIEVYDNIPPVLTGPDTIQISYTEALKVEDILPLLAPSDNNTNLTTNDIQIVTDLYTNRTEEIGVYTIQFKVVDASGLEAYHTVEITVVDDQLPIIFVDDYIVKINPDVTFNQQDALNLLIHSKELNEGDYAMQVLIDEYTGNEKIPGLYVYQVAFENEVGETYVKDFIIEVIDEHSIADYRGIISTFGLSISFIIFVILKKKK